MVTIEINLDPLFRLGSYCADQGYQVAAQAKNGLVSAANSAYTLGCDLSEDLGLNKENLPAVTSALSFATNASIYSLGFINIPTISLFLATGLCRNKINALQEQGHSFTKRDIEHLQAANINRVLRLVALVNPTLAMIGTLLNANQLTGFIKVSSSEVKQS